MKAMWGWWLAVLSLTIFCAGAAADEKSKGLLEQAIAAHGSAKLEKFPAAKWEGKGVIHLTGMQIPYTGEWASAGPDKMRIELMMEIAGDKIRVLNVFNGKEGWTMFGDDVNAFDPDALAEMKELTHVNWAQRLYTLRQDGYTLTAVPDIQNEGRAAKGFQVSHKGYRDFTFYFDAQSFLLVKSTCQVRDEETREFVGQEEFYSDYKEVAGVKLPMTLKVKRSGKDFLEATTKTYSPLEKLNDDLFQKPGK